MNFIVFAIPNLPIEKLVPGSTDIINRWRKKLRDAAGNTAALVPRSRAPLNHRQPNWPSALVAEIKALRTRFPNLGKQRLHVLLADIAQFNRKLAHWLIQYNTVLPHHSLGLKTPVQFLIQHKPECHIYWTNTRTWIGASFS